MADGVKHLKEVSLLILCMAQYIMTIYLFAKRQKSLKNPKQLYIQLHNY